jgi:hypothetical protein
MVSYSNTTTRRLEGYARARGIKGLAIVISPDNTCGRYFVVNVNGEPLRYWRSLGWTVRDAQEAIEMWNA